VRAQTKTPVAICAPLAVLLLSLAVIAGVWWWLATPVTRCIRTYSIENGLDKVPKLASKVGLQVSLGVWLGRDRLKNAELINTATLLASKYPGVISAMMGKS
jgi:exo-beta-1,3-glucanase (GH17 family)